MGISKASGTWTGTLKTGLGAMKPANGPEVPFSLATRFEGKKGSNPEEMIGAALAGCFSKLRAIAEETKKQCPVGKALAAVQITTEARLA